MSKPITLEHDTTLEGFALFKGDLKVAVVNTMQQGPPEATMVDGHPVAKVSMVSMPRSSWQVHFTSPQMPVALIEAVVAAIPTDEDQTHATPRREE